MRERDRERESERECVYLSEIWLFVTIQRRHSMTFKALHNVIIHVQP